MATDIMMTANARGYTDRIAERGHAIARLGAWAITITLAVIFLWFGSLKFIGFEQEGLLPIIANNPLISWLYPLFGKPDGASRAALFPALVPATAMLIGIPTTGETPTIVQLVGLALSMLGLVVALRSPAPTATAQ